VETVSSASTATGSTRSEPRKDVVIALDEQRRYELSSAWYLASDLANHVIPKLESVGVPISTLQFALSELKLEIETELGNPNETMFDEEEVDPNMRLVNLGGE
jgi:hypothetical protein